MVQKNRIVSKTLIGILMIATLNSSLARADDGVRASGFISSDQAQVPSELTTSDSRLTVRLQIPEDAKWITLYVAKDGTQYDPIAKAFAQSKVDRNSATQTIVFTEGPGKYTLRFWYTSSPNASGALKSLSTFYVFNSDNRDHEFSAPTLGIQSDDNAIQELAYSLTKGATSDEQRLTAIRKWISENVRYDYDEAARREAITKALQDKNIGDSAPVFNMSSHDQDAVSVVQSLSAVCDGYSKLVAALTRAAGLKSKIIIGHLKTDPKEVVDPVRVCSNPSGIEHAWNEVYLSDSGTWISVDTTHDATKYLSYLQYKSESEKQNQKIENQNEKNERQDQATKEDLMKKYPGLKDFYSRQPEAANKSTPKIPLTELPKYPDFSFDQAIHTRCYEKSL